MKISLSPQLSIDTYTLSVSGDVLTIDGKEYDFGPLAEGDLLPIEAVNCKWLISDVTREEGHVCLTLVLPHGYNAPEETRFPKTLVVTSDGPITLPPYDEPQVSEVVPEPEAEE